MKNFSAILEQIPQPFKLPAWIICDVPYFKTLLALPPTSESIENLTGQFQFIAA